MDNPGSQNIAMCKPVTTFVQTDTNTFRDVVQRLTGPSDNIAVPEITNVVKPATPKKPTSKLHERRQGMRPKLEIVKPPPSFKAIGSVLSSKAGNTCILSSPVGTPSSLFSTLTLMEEEKAVSEIYTPNSKEEEKAIRERRFYLHPSPRSKQGFTEPELLPLFPLTSPNSSLKP